MCTTNCAQLTHPCRESCMCSMLHNRDIESQNYWKLLRLRRLKSCYLCCAQMCSYVSSTVPPVNIRTSTNKRRSLSITWRYACAYIMSPNRLNPDRQSVQMRLNWLDPDPWCSADRPSLGTLLPVPRLPGIERSHYSSSKCKHRVVGASIGWVGWCFLCS